MYFKCIEMIIKKVPARSSVQIAAHGSGKYTNKEKKNQKKNNLVHRSTEKKIA